MARAVFFLIVFTASTLLAQNCTTYVMVDPFDSKTGHGIDNLKAENFQVKAGNTLLPVTSATMDFSNRVLVLVETTGTAEDKEMSDLIQKIADMARQAPAGRSIAFGAFAEETVITKDFLGDQQKRSAAITEVMEKAAQFPGRNGAYLDSLHQGIAAFGPHQPGDTILILTDGHDDRSKHNQRDLEKEFAATGTRLLVVIRPRYKPVGRDFNQHAREEDYSLKILASRTGGAYTGFKYEHFFDFAWAGYMLGIETPAAINKPTDWKLEVKGADGKVNKNAFLYHPWQLTPCTALSAASKPAP